MSWLLFCNEGLNSGFLRVSVSVCMCVYVYVSCVFGGGRVHHSMSGVSFGQKKHIGVARPIALGYLPYS